MVRALRPHQWAKNLLVAAPLLASHRFREADALVATLFAFAAFSLGASAAYILNDLLDLEADRAHPRKRARPFASGALGVPAGIALGTAAFVAGAAVSLLLPVMFRAAFAAYFLLALAYSMGLKRAAMLDVVSLAALYTLRIVGGTFAIGVALSFWLLGFSMFLFFSLALVKRYAELLALESEGIAKAPGRGYGGRDADIVLSIGTASAMVSALVLALYVNGETAKALYSRPALLWLVCPLFLYWISRMWLLASRGRMHEDPVLFAVRDPASYVVAALTVAIAYAAI